MNFRLQDSEYTNCPKCGDPLIVAPDKMYNDFCTDCNKVIMRALERGGKLDGLRRKLDDEQKKRGT